MKERCASLSPLGHVEDRLRHSKRFQIPLPVVIMVANRLTFIVAINMAALSKPWTISPELTFRNGRLCRQHHHLYKECCGFVRLSQTLSASGVDELDASTGSSSLSSSNDLESSDASRGEDSLKADVALDEQMAAVGNLVADDEWLGLSMELSDVVRKAVVEDLKKNLRDFLDKDDYAIGDISKQIDKRVKQEVANYRGKQQYELGDLVWALDETSKSLTEQMTGKPYETGDLSIELDKRIKEAVVQWAGKPAGTPYETGDLTKEMTRRIEERVNEFTGKDSYEFGDIARTIEENRREWMREYLGEEAAANYKFGDLTKKAVTQFTGKDNYEFGDITKKVLGNFFSKGKKSTSQNEQ
jgi:hypothetical protein